MNNLHHDDQRTHQTGGSGYKTTTRPCRLLFIPLSDTTSMWHSCKPTKTGKGVLVRRRGSGTFSASVQHTIIVTWERFHPAHRKMGGSEYRTKTTSEVAKRLEIGAEADHQTTVSEFGESFHLESLEA